MLLTNTLVDITRWGKTKEKTQHVRSTKIASDLHGTARLCVFRLTCISVHKKQRCGLSYSESADDRLPSLGLASDSSDSLLQPLHSELRKKEER